VGDLPDPAGAGGEDGDAGGSDGTGGKAAGGSGNGGDLPADGGAGGAETGGKSGGSGGVNGTGGAGTGGGIITDGGSPGTGGLDGGPDASDGGSGGAGTGGAATGGTGGAATGGAGTGGTATGGTGTGGTATGGAATGGAATGGKGTGGLSTCTTDADHDGFLSAACGGNDCDDSNGAVFPGQVNYFDAVSPKGNYDYNCNSVPEKDPALNKYSVCSGLLSLGGCNLTTDTYVSGSAGTPPACGVAAAWGKCVKVSLNLSCGVGTTTQVKMACH
jgi:hypothetical protein